MKKLRVPGADGRGPGAAGRRQGRSTSPRRTGRPSSTSSARSRELGHEVQCLGVGSDLGVIRQRHRRVPAAHRLQPARGLRRRPDLRPERRRATSSCCGVPYTGCNPRGLMLARDKGSRRSCSPTTASRCPSSRSSAWAAPVRRPRRLAFPLIVKSLTKEGSAGISQASVVDDDDKLAERVALHPRAPAAPTPSSSATSTGASSTSASSATSACRCSRSGSCCSPRCPRKRRASPPSA